MPNWCYGNIRIKGKEENVGLFLKNGCTPGTGEHTECKRINGTNGIIENMKLEQAENGFSEVTAEFRFAWNVSAFDFSEIAKKHKVSFFITACEVTNFFEQEIVVDDAGQILKNDQKDISAEILCSGADHGINVQYRKMTLLEFQKLKKGDVFYVRINDTCIKQTVENCAFYNDDADEPDWEILCASGTWVCWDSAYAAVA